MRQFPVMFALALFISTAFAQTPAPAVSLAPADVAEAFLAEESLTPRERRRLARERARAAAARTTTRSDGEGTTWVSVPLAATTIINDRGRRVRAREVPATDLAEEGDEGETHDAGSVPGALVLRDARDYLIFVGDERDIGTMTTPLTGHVAFAMAGEMTVAATRSAMERTAVDSPAVFVGDTGPVSDRPVSRVTSVPFDPSATAALAFYVSGESNGRDAFDAMVGPGVTFHLGDVAQELSLGLRGSAPTSFDLQALLSNPLTTIAQMQNGWFISHRISVRVWEFASGSLSFIARAQVDDGSAGLGVMGWAGISITAGSGDASH